MYDHIGHKLLRAPVELIQVRADFSGAVQSLVACETCEKRWPFFDFFHVFRILSFHGVFRGPVRGSRNAGRAAKYAAALWRLAHSGRGKIFSLRVAAPLTALFITLGLSIVLGAAGFSYIV